jgi:hypothetical protein
MTVRAERDGKDFAILAQALRWPHALIQQEIRN